MGSRDTFLKGRMKKALCFLYLGQHIKPEKREKNQNPGQAHGWVNIRYIIDEILIRKQNSSVSDKMFKSLSQLYTCNFIQN